jgi:hypothetical protein
VGVGMFTPPGGSPQARIGAWVISLGNAVANGDTLVFEDLGCVAQAAAGAKFFSSMRLLGSVEGRRLDAYRKSAGMTPLEMHQALACLESTGRIEITKRDVDKIESISILSADAEEVYSFANTYFENVFATDCAHVAIGILDATMRLPMLRSDVIQHVTIALGYDDSVVTLALKHLEVLGAIQVSANTEGGEVVIYNPLLFSNTNQDALEALARLGGTERDRVLQIVDHVKHYPGVPLPAAQRGQAYDVLKQCGIIDASRYSPHAGQSAYEFPTLSTAWSRVVFSDNTEASEDLIHDAKALLASIRYGEYYASIGKGRIRDAFVLLRALVRRGSVGPASSIGTDYPVIASMGIVNIVENPALPGRYSMELVKVDVAQPVLDMIGGDHSEDANEQPDLTMEGGFTFQPPEAARVEELKESIAELRDYIIFEQLVRGRRT